MRAAMTTRGRRLAAVAVVLMAAVLVIARLVPRGDAIVSTGDPCADPPRLQTRTNVTLQPKAMKAYRAAQRLARRPIEVVQSYRSCAAQAIACQNICGDANGCPGTCARPGTSYHQLGAAIDISEASLASPGVVSALREAGWCQSVPASDPGHFSFGGCH